MIHFILLSAALSSQPLPQMQKTVPTDVREPNCAMPSSFYDMESCRGHDYPEAFFEMEAAWETAVQSAQKYEQTTARERDAPLSFALSRVQGEWLGYRDKHCESLIVLEDDVRVRSENWSACMARLTKARASELRAYSETMEGLMK